MALAAEVAPFGIRVLIVEPGAFRTGDPAKAAAAILTVLDDPQPPLRLALGSDAADAIGAALDRSREELRAWDELSRSTDF